MSDSIPVILCGKSPQIAQGVKQALLPEYEVVHVILTPAAGVAEIPIVLEGNTPPPSETENIGTKTYSRVPKAVITGAGYDDAAFEEMRKASEEKSNVPWIRPNLDTPTPPLGPLYGAAVVERCKVCLKKLAEAGRLGDDGVYFY